MKKVLALFVFISAISCKETQKSTSSSEEQTMVVLEMAPTNYPKALSKVFEAHGGLESWKRKRTLVYDLPKPGGVETHTTDLYTRKDKIEMGEVSMGYDGTNVWLLDDTKTYKGDPVFYHNLMFYFYAMPFVLADDGINYDQAEPLEFDGVSYPGVQITYNTGVGTSPKDEYYLYYDPKTYQMAWLGYTVTYRSGEKSDNVKWIRYKDWMNVNGLQLPKTLTWYSYEGRDIKEPKNSYTFEKVLLDETKKPNGFYTMPENAKVILKEDKS